MDLLSFLMADPNVPFGIAGAFLLLLLALEVIGVLFTGLGISSISEMIHGDGHEIAVGEIAADALGYLHWGKVPLLAILASLTGLFSLLGYGAQGLAQSLSGGFVPSWLAAIPAGVLSVVGTHYVAKPIAALMPTDRGDAPTERGMLGLVGEVVLGPVEHHLPGEVRVRDLHGKEHFLSVKAKSPGEVIPLGAEVVITGINESFYTVGLTALPAPAPAPASLTAANRKEV